MSCQRRVKSYRSDSGWIIHLLEDRSLTTAAALISCPVGSHQEPKQWPGLAHLTEHLLFAGGNNYPAAERLMPWVQTRGGRVNATTLQNRTAFYFEVATAELWAGVDRLIDMIHAPTLALAAIATEIAVIDAEYRLMQQDPERQIDAVLQSQLTEPEQFSQFQVGSAQHFGSDLEALQQAVRQFWQAGYPPEKRQLWILTSAPEAQTAAELSQRIGEKLHPYQGDEGCGWQTARQELRLTTEPQQLRLKQAALYQSWLLNRGERGDGGLLAILEQLLTDAAPGTLLAWLRECYGEALCLTLAIKYQEAERLYLALAVGGVSLTGQQRAGLLVELNHWLGQLPQLTSAQLAHYWQLAWQHCYQKSPMERLRTQALERTPPEQPPALTAWQNFLQRLNDAPSQTLILVAEPAQHNHNCQGFEVDLRPLSPLPLSSRPAEREFCFYPRDKVSTPAPETAFYSPAPLALDPAAFSSGVRVLLRPAPGSRLDPALRTLLQQRSEAAVSYLRHFGGSAEWQQRGGVDYLVLSVTEPTRLCQTLEILAQVWARPMTQPAIVPAIGLLIRELLSQLPGFCGDPQQPLRWCAQISGGGADEQRQIARYLGLLPLSWHTLTATAASPPRHGKQHWLRPEAEHALVVFLPLANTHPVTIQRLQSLSTLYEPHFYHWLREELAVGYAVFCRYQTMMDRVGILFAIQSPQFSCQQLMALIEAFLERITGKVNHLDDHATQQAETGADGLERSLMNFELRCRQGDSHADPLTIEQLHQSMRDAAQRRQGIWLSAGPEEVKR